MVQTRRQWRRWYEEDRAIRLQNRNMEAEDRDVQINSPRRSEQDNFEYSTDNYDYDPDTVDNIYNTEHNVEPQFLNPTVRRGRVPQQHNTHGPQYNRGNGLWRPKLYYYEDWEHRHRKKDNEAKTEIVRGYRRRSGVN